MNGRKAIAELLASADRDEILNFLARNILDNMLDAGYFRSCLNCRNWNSEFEVCKLVNKRPPATVIVAGCELHTDTNPDEIPF